DPVGCINLTVVSSFNNTPTPVASGTALAQGSVSLPPASLDVIVGTIQAVANDSTGGKTTVTHTIYVETSSLLDLVASGNGRVLDFDDGRLLLQTADGSLFIQRRLDGSVTKIGTADIETATLTPTGAAWIDKSGPGCPSLWHYIAGQAAVVVQKCFYD